MKLFDKDQLKKWGVVDYAVTGESHPLSLDHYNLWVDKKYHLPLNYMEGDRQLKRQDILEYWPDFKGAVVFLFSYHESHKKLTHLYQCDPNWNGLKLASYTLGFEGEDYHHIIRERLNEIAISLKKLYPDLQYRLTLDTHPVLERDLAMRAGLGWFGKNSMLIHKTHGSFFIIGSILINQEIEQEQRGIETDHCGQCTRCIDACPTKAIEPLSRTIRAHDCISTFTIEQFKLDSIPSDKMTLKEGTLFGCDICQDVCPWNKRVDRISPDVDSEFHLPEQKKILDFFILRDKKILAQELEGMSEGEFKRKFLKTSFFRSGRRGLLKNIRFFLNELGLF